MKILLLGCEGMLGGELFAQLKEDYEVVGKDIQDFDIASADDCRSMVEDNHPDMVINAVAFTDVDGCEAHRDKCFAVNADGVGNVALACRDRGIKIVHFGTDYVFDGAKGLPYCESDACRPMNVYGEAKLAGEKALFNITDNFLLVRTAWLYGARGKNFVKTIMEKAKSTKRLEVVDDQIGSPTYACDLAGAVKRLIEDDGAGIYHITNGGSCSWYEFAQAILEYAGLIDVEVKPIKSDKLARPAIRPCYSVLDSSEFYRITVMAMRPWRAALRDCVQKIKSFP
jgi:dTDP-4-dehydrorhamnose reductase